MSAVAAPPVAIGTVQSTHSTARAFAVAALSVLTTLFVVLSVLTLSVHSLLLDTNRWGAAMDAIAADPTVQDALSAYVAQRTVMATGLSQRLDEAFPRQPLIAAGMTSAVNELFHKTLASALASSTFQRTWSDLTRTLHAELVATLRGDPSARLKIHDETLFLDLTPFVVQGTQVLRERVPGFAEVAPPALQSPVNAEVPIVQSNQLAILQWVVRALDILVFVLPLSAVALAASTLFLATRRLRMLAILAAEIAVAFLLIQLATNAVIDYATASSRDAASSVIRTLVADILRLDILVIALAIVVAVTAVLIALFREPWSPFRYAADRSARNRPNSNQAMPSASGTSSSSSAIGELNE